MPTSCSTPPGGHPGRRRHRLAGAIPVWQRANLAYLGGVPFTPVESNYTNAVIFDDVSVADNAAASVYAAKTLGAKTAAIIYTSDTQGTSVADNVLAPVMKNVGYTKVTKIPVPPTATDVTSAVAAAISSHPDIVYIDDPNSCPQVLSSLKQLGSTAKVLGVDPCTSPAAIAAANGGASGMYYSSPVQAPDAGTTQSNLYLAVLKKYAPKTIPIDSLTAMGFATVLNVQAALAHFTHGPADHGEDPGRVPQRQQPPQLHGPPVHLRRQATGRGDRGVQRLPADPPGAGHQDHCG